MAGLYRIEVNSRGLSVVMNTARLNLDPGQLQHLGWAIRDTAARAQMRAVRNVSGYPVMYDGKVFRVVVRTGALKGAMEMEWPYQSVLQARVYVNGSHTAQPIQMGDGIVKPRPVADYAAAIEFGHEEIDLKKYMQGKVVPFFASRSSSSTGPFAARGLTPVAGPGDLWENKSLNARLAHPLLGGGRKGAMLFQRRASKAYDGGKKGGGAYYISFRRVGKTGWIIPAARPRPFMRAATTGPTAQRDARQFTRQRLMELMNPNGRPNR